MYGYNPQVSIDRINNQINELERLKSQIPQPPAINQTFQLAPNNLGGLRYFNTIDEVNKETVYNDTPFFSKDLSILWIKNSKGEIKSYELKEIIQKDEKDIQIELLQNQLNEVRKELEYVKSNNTNVDEPIKSEEPSNVQHIKSTKTKQWKS